MNQDTCIRVLADPVQIRQCKDELKRRQQAVTGLTALLSLASNEARLKILYFLHLEGELCPCDMSDILQMSTPAVSQHLRKMKDGGLIGARKVGQTIFYSTRKAHLKTLSLLLSEIMTFRNKQNVI